MANENGKKKHTKLKVTLGGIVVAGLAYAASCVFVPQNTILKGVVMNGVELSELTIEEAEKKLEEQYQKDYEKASLTVNALKEDYKVPMYSSLVFDSKKAAEEAFAYGHEEYYLRGGQMIKAMLLPEEMTHYPEIKNQTALDEELKKVGLTDLNTTIQTVYELKDQDLQFTMGVTGYSVDMPELNKALGEAVAINDYSTVIESPMLQGTVEPMDMDAIYEEIHKEKRDATLDPKNKYKLVKSITGIDFDKEEAKKMIAAAKEGAIVSVPIKKDLPKISTEDMKKHLFEATLGSCTTNVSGTEARKSNVRLASSTIDGTILMPGEEFAYNDRVGQRTAARGYKPAPAYVSGKSVDELGGGVCQVSSTLYKATVLANLEIVEHHNHTYESAYIGLGMDATVSWGGPDYRFKNNMDYPIKITMDYSGGSLTCHIVGAKLNDNKVVFSADVLKTIGHGTKYVDDKELEKGKEKLISSGHNGYVVQTYRTIVDKDGNTISREKEDYNVYSKKDDEVARGTKEPPKKPVVPKKPGAQKQPAQKPVQNQPAPTQAPAPQETQTPAQ